MSLILLGGSILKCRQKQAYLPIILKPISARQNDLLIEWTTNCIIMFQIITTNTWTI